MTTLTVPQTTAEQAGPFTKHTFPDGSSLAFHEKNHAYWSGCKSKFVKGEEAWSGTMPRLAGVSTVCKPFDFNPDQLMGWAAKQDHEAIVQIYGGKKLPEDPATVRSALYLNELTWTQKRDKKADTGKAAHAKILHRLALGEEPDLGVLLPTERGYGQAIYKWWLDRDPQVLHAEQVVASIANNIAGTLDLHFRSSDPFRSGTVLMDAKARGFIPASSLAQVAGYSACLTDCGLAAEAPEHLLILKLLEDGTYEEIWVDEGLTPDERHANFWAGVRVYRQAAAYSKQVGR